MLNQIYLILIIKGVFKIITIGIGGGTGNQMFQYSIARSLSLDLDMDFALNLYQYNLLPKFLKKDHERYNLQHFNIKENISPSSEFLKLLLKEKLTYKINYIQEKNPNINFDIFEKEILELKNKNDLNEIFLRGNWGDERYFSHNSETIKKDFEIITPPNKENQKFIKEISSVNAVALCIRRGDYLLPLWKAQAGFPTIDYFLKAVEIINEKVDNPIFYIFSNDPNWVKENIKIDNPTKYLSHNNFNTDYEDLRLMSLCKHFIIANSTFHWWGAWLSSNSDKIVIAPNPWHNSHNLSNIIPDNWIKLKCDRSELFEQSLEEIFKWDQGIELLKNEKIKFNAFEIVKKNKNDSILKISITSKNRGHLKIKNNETKPIFIEYDCGTSDRYIVLDEKISIRSLIISNNSNTSISIDYIGIKSLKSSY